MYPVFSSGLCLMTANLCSECLGHVNIDCWRQGRVYIAHCVPYQLAMGYYLPYQGAVGGGDDVFVQVAENILIWSICYTLLLTSAG